VVQHAIQEQVRNQSSFLQIRREERLTLGAFFAEEGGNATRNRESGGGCPDGSVHPRMAARSRLESRLRMNCQTRVWSGKKSCDTVFPVFLVEPGLLALKTEASRCYWPH
jgi:hypothetical protein